MENLSVCLFIYLFIFAKKHLSFVGVQLYMIILKANRKVS